MGKETGIEWCHHTFNPWWGCARVSAGCQHCYAETFAKRTGHDVWGTTGDRRFFGDRHWAEPVRWNAAAAEAGERRRVFCASMADVFEARPDLIEQRRRLWDLIAATPALDWLLLTKRPENVARMVPQSWMTWYGPPIAATDWPANVWIGTTVESAATVDRAKILRTLPAPVRFLSCEPLLGPLDDLDLAGINWVIAGGESGPGARPMHPQWVRNLRDACLDAREPCEIPDVPRPHSVAVPGGGRACACEYPRPIPFLFKQWGDWAPVDPGTIPPRNAILLDVDGERRTTNDTPRLSFPPGWARLVRLGKRDAGRTLDGVEWTQYPSPTPIWLR